MAAKAVCKNENDYKNCENTLKPWPIISHAEKALEKKLHSLEEKKVFLKARNHRMIEEKPNVLIRSFPLLTRGMVSMFVVRVHSSKTGTNNER